MRIRKQRTDQIKRLLGIPDQIFAQILVQEPETMENALHILINKANSEMETNFNDFSVPGLS